MDKAQRQSASITHNQATRSAQRSSMSRKVTPKAKSCSKSRSEIGRPFT
jgi:hypothetical protein